VHRMVSRYLRYRLGWHKRMPLPPGGVLLDNPALAILELLNSPFPTLIGRIGGVECEAISQFIGLGRTFRKQVHRLQKNAGFYCSDESDLARFVDVNLEAISSCDLLAYWDCAGQYELVSSYGSEAEYCSLRCLEPFWPGQDWLSPLSGKRVCVVSPFGGTMSKQVMKIASIHPSLSLENHTFSFVNAPMTNGGYEVARGDPSWFDRLTIMAEDVKAKAPDVVLIGAGAYGLPLGSILKNAGFSSVVCGGALQLYFGIRGARWDQREDYKAIFNQSWTRASSLETPVGSGTVENGCYW